MKKIMIAAIAVCAMATPAAAQSLADQVRGLKNSMGQMLGHKSSNTSAQTSTTAVQNGIQTNGAGEREMITQEALADDASMTTLSSVPVRKGDVSTYDILGFKLGMSGSEVQAIARRQHIMAKYPNAPSPYTGDFELEATRIANHQLSNPRPAHSKRVISEAYGIMADGSNISFTFTLTPAGARLSQVNYSTKQNGQTDEQLRQAMQARYGKPNWDLGYQEFWCNGTVKCPVNDQSPTLKEFHSDGQVLMEMYQSTAYNQKAEATLKARAAQIAAASGGGVRF